MHDWSLPFVAGIMNRSDFASTVHDAQTTRLTGRGVSKALGVAWIAVSSCSTRENAPFRLQGLDAMRFAITSKH